MLLRGRLVAAVVGEDRRARTALLIQPGRSKNGPFYAPAMLREAVGLFEGKPVHVFPEVDSAGNPRRREHVKDAGLVGRTPMNVVGVTRNARYVEGKGVVAEVVFLENTAADETLRQIESMEKAGALDLVGLSMDASGDMDPRTGWARIRHVASVDVVTDPAAGGRVLHRIAASVNSAGSFHAMKVLLTLARERFPRLVEGLGDSPTDFGFARHVATKAKADAALLPILAGAIGLASIPADLDAMGLLDHGHTFVAKLREAAEKAAETATDGDPVAAATAEAKRILEAAKSGVDAGILELDRARTAFRLTEALSTAKLPATAETRIRESFKGKVATVEEIGAAITGERTYVDGLVGAAVRGSAGTRIVESSADKLGNVLGFMLNPTNLRLAEGVAAQPYMGSMREFLFHQFGIRLESIAYEGEAARQRFKEAVDTTAFSKVYADAMNRGVTAAYEGAIRREADWRKLVKVVSLSDFRTQHRINVGYYGNIPTVAKGGTYLALTTPSDREETYALAKKGGLESITLEDMMNDDLGLWQTMIQRIGQACQETAYEAVMALTRISSMPTMQDTYKLGSASRSPVNLLTTALTADSTGKTALITAIRGMMAGTGGSGQKKGVVPRYAIIPLEKIEAFAYVVGQLRAGLTGTDANDVLRLLGVALPEAIVDYGSDSTTDWPLMADPMRATVIEFGTLGGRTAPEMIVADGQSFGNLFTRDQLDHKVRFFMVAAAVDPLGFFANDAAS